MAQTVKNFDRGDSPDVLRLAGEARPTGRPRVLCSDEDASGEHALVY